MNEPYIVNVNDAPKISRWIKFRHGVMIWRSVNLSNPGASWTTPVIMEDGTRATRPTWEADNKPERIITDPAEVMVSFDKEVKRFRVGIRIGTQGFVWKVTDAGTRRIWREEAKAGKGAYHVFDYDTQEAVIMAPDRQIPLVEWEAEYGKR